MRMFLAIPLMLQLTFAAFGAPSGGDSGGEPAPPPVKWTMSDSAGGTFAVPGQGPTLLLFVMAHQERSAQAMAIVRQRFEKVRDVQVAAVLSGPGAEAEAAKLAGGGDWPWPVLADPGHDTAGAMAVHAWPTSVVVDAAGRQVAHIGGLPQSLGRDLEVHLDFARGRIDAEARRQRLADNDPVTDHNGGAAPPRVAMLIERLIERGQLDEARRELAAAADKYPGDPSLQLPLARLHLRTAAPRDALAVLDAIDPAQVPAWQLQAMRGQASLQLNQLDDAHRALTQALALNPRPAEAHYLLGQLHQRRQEWQRAADHYRQAFEATAEGKPLATSD